jgi:hypothetical protein
MCKKTPEIYQNARFLHEKKAMKTAVNKESR